MLIQRACKHEWEIIKTVHVDTDGYCDYDRIYLQYKKCGKLKCKSMKQFLSPVWPNKYATICEVYL